MDEVNLMELLTHTSCDGVKNAPLWIKLIKDIIRDHTIVPSKLLLDYLLEQNIIKISQVLIILTVLDMVLDSCDENDRDKALSQMRLKFSKITIFPQKQKIAFSKYTSNLLLNCLLAFITPTFLHWIMMIS